MKRYKSLVFVFCCILVLTSCSSKSGHDSRADIPVITPASGTDNKTDASESEPTPPSASIIPEGPSVIETRNNNALRWIGNHENASAIIMTKEQIEAENARILRESPSLVDLSSYPEFLSKGEVINLIEAVGSPSLPKYTDSGREITVDDLTDIAINKNADAIPDDVTLRMGIVTKRANIRQVPLGTPLHSSPDSPHDRIQDTEIGLGQRVLVIHESLDGLFWYVQSGNYRGWVDKTYIAITDSREEWMMFGQPDNFVIVTEAVLNVGDVSYDLGARIPLISVSDGKYKIYVPERNSDGFLEIKEAYIDSDKASVGYVPFTYENLVALAFKYEGYPYSWGGYNESVDCSGFVVNVLRCFGFVIPRDTGAQNKVVGSHTDVSDLSASDKASRLKAVTKPACVYISGHVRLYLGYENGLFYYIDSSVAGNGVSVTTKNNADDILYIDVIGG